QQNIRLARAGFLPRLALNASYGYSDRTTSSDSPNFAEDINSTSKDASVRLNLSLNLFNGFRNRIDVQNARLAAENSVLVLKDARNALSAQVREQHLTLEKRLALVALEEQNVQAAQQNLALQQDRYEIGATSSIEFRDAQVNLIRAESALIAARFQARLSRIAIDRLTGRLEIE
ncbi:TolC family protein, partial [candidate division KSB1 bacterium]|nr:TolC family protein [candidate division KSB1 bacterium]